MEPTPDRVLGQLGRVLASAPFVTSERLSRFLRYVVERTLAGEGDRLKEYVIGTEVFERGEQYDPRIDSIVRVEAGRLRAKLEEYYQHYGANDEVVIRIPRGGYAAVFELRRPAAAASDETAVATRRARWSWLAATAAVMLVAIGAWAFGFRLADSAARASVTIAVLPFASYSTDETARIAARLTDGITSELARNDSLAVASHTSALQFAGPRRSVREIARALNADFIMEGSVHSDNGRLRIVVRLVDAAADRKYWVEEFAGGEGDVPALEGQIAAAAAAALAARTARR